jgi:tetratricopeptide (TPR) repeat protein
LFGVALTTRALFFVAATLFLVAPAAAQTREGEALQRLLRAYKQDAGRGVAQLIAANEDEIDRLLKACRGTQSLRDQVPPRGLVGDGPPACSRHDFLTFSQLFQDAAIELLARDYNRSGRFVGHGEYLLESLFRDYPDHTPLEIKFISLWYAHGTRFLLTQHFLQRAINLVEKVRTWLPENAEIEVTRGLVAEIPAGWLASNPRGKERTVIDENVAPFTFYRPSSGPNQGPYQAAVNQYLEALSIEPNHVRALLHLAWARVRGRDGRAAQDAQRALQHAGDDDERYLAYLLIAAAADVKEEPYASLDAYAAARQVGPRYQSACTGLAGAYGSAGDRASASRTALECMAIEPDDSHPDPWLTLRFGLTERSVVDWLDAEARRP